MNDNNQKPDAPKKDSKPSEADEKMAKESTKKPNPLEAYYDGLPGGEEVQLYRRGRKPRRVVWSIAWSDLMMTMFILFAVLYIYQAANREFSFIKQVEADAAPESVTETVAPPKVETLIESVDASASRSAGMDTDTLRLRNLADIGTVELQEDKAVRIVLPGDLLFDTGSSDLKASALETLRQVGDVIRITDSRVNVVGHTDNVPMHSEKFATNWELSALRACVVARFLTEQMRLSPSRFYVSGHSYLQPVAPNDTPKNRAANRRVELILTKGRPSGTKDEGQ